VFITIGPYQATGSCRVGAGVTPTPPTDPYVTNSVIRFVSNGHCGPKTLQLTTPQGDMTVAAHPSANPRTRTFVQSTPVSLRQFAGSKSLLPFLGADVIPGIAFPRSGESYRGSLGPRFPTHPGNGVCSSLPRGTVRCYDCLRPSRSVRFWLPSGTLG